MWMVVRPFVATSAGHEIDSHRLPLCVTFYIKLVAGWIVPRMLMRPRRSRTQRPIHFSVDKVGQSKNLFGSCYKTFNALSWLVSSSGWRRKTRFVKLQPKNMSRRYFTTKDVNFNSKSVNCYLFEFITLLALLFFSTRMLLFRGNSIKSVISNLNENSIFTNWYAPLP